MALNQRKDYSGNSDKQGDKIISLAKSKSLVAEIQAIFKPLLAYCEPYESDVTMGSAPAVPLPNGKNAIAPDILCKTQNGNTFWIEVKDKSQRFYHPDTGADLFQVYGWHQINLLNSEPVLVIFKDPDFESCLPKSPNDALKNQFRQRWERFNGNYYGNWLSRLMTITDRYPRIFTERSRELDMYILYFLVDYMKPITNFSEFVDSVDGKTIPNVEKEFKAYFHQTNSLLTEIEVRKLILEIFKRRSS